MSGFLPSSSFDRQGLERSRQKLNLLYLNYHNAYVYQTWQGGGLFWGASFNKVTQHFETWSRDNLKTYVHYQNIYGHMSS